MNKRYMRKEPLMTPNTLIIDKKPAGYSNYPVHQEEINFNDTIPLGKSIILTDEDEKKLDDTILCFNTSVMVEYI